MLNTHPNAAVLPVYGCKPIRKQALPQHTTGNALNKNIICEATNNTSPVPQQALSFIILLRRAQQLLPVVVPCAGTLNRSGRYIKQYQALASGITPAIARNHNEVQLVQLGLQMLRLAVQLPGQLNAVSKAAMPSLQQWFGLWQQALVLLATQPFVRSYVLPAHQRLQHIPRRHQLHYCTVSAQTPVLQWVLEAGATQYRFYAQLVINGYAYTHFNTAALPLIDINGCYYLPASLQDAAILESLGTISFAKNKYPLFEKKILNVLTPFYTVNRL